MLLVWMLSVIVFTTLMGLAATALDAAVRLLSGQARRVWLTALAISVVWPACAPLFSRQQVVRLSTIVVRDTSLEGSLGALGRIPALATAGGHRLNATLAVLWALLSLTLLMRLVRTQFAVTLLARSGTRATVDGCDVLLLPDFGPCTIGLWRPRIALPSWIIELDQDLRSLVVRHEHEHQRARDTALLWIAELAIALMPWNPALWWQAQRLRLSVELDCDQRTMRADAASSTYARLLLLVSQRQSLAHRLPSIASFDSHLHQRITAMLRQRVTYIPFRIASLTAFAVLALVSACSRQVRGGMSAPPAPTVAKMSPDAIYTDKSVEKPVSLLTPESKAPEYPAELRAAHTEGEALVEFVVDTNGRAMIESFKVLKTTDARFAAAVLSALPGFRYTAATIPGGQKVKQRVVEPFIFAMQR